MPVNVSKSTSQIINEITKNMMMNSNEMIIGYSNKQTYGAKEQTYEDLFQSNSIAYQ